MASQPETIPPETASAGEVRGRLVSIGGGAHVEYPLDKPMLKVGSHPSNDIVLNETTVSRYHATISRKLGRFVLTDLDSTNGTTVNGRRITGSTTLKRGDELRFGATRFGFMAAGETIARTSALNPTRIAIVLLAMFIAGFAAARYFLGPHPIHTATVEIKKSLSEKSASTSAASATTAALPEATSSVSVVTGPQPPWLQQLNYYREMAKLPAITEDGGLTAGDEKHVAYLVTNYGDEVRKGILPGLEMHQESDSKPGYTPVGLNAAQHSDVDFMWWKGRTPTMETWAVDDWITGAFHRLPLLSPRLEHVGYAQDCENNLCVAAMNAQSDVLRTSGATLYRTPVAFPPDGSVLGLKWFTAEMPNPLSACPGYSKPTGVPVTLQLGNQIAIKLDSYSLQQVDPSGAATDVETCGFDSSTYTSPDPAIQAAARETLNAFGAVVIVPREPFIPGAHYRVSLTASGKSYEWKFSVSP
jgi:FHA domain